MTIKLENKLEIYSYFKLENKLEIFEFFVNGQPGFLSTHNLYNVHHQTFAFWSL